MGIFDRFPYSSTHEMNLDFMLGKATEIAEDMQRVTAGMAQVQAGLSAISEKTEQATQAAAQAAASASSIEGSVTAAEEAAEEAQMHNESAQTWANNAMTYKADCQRSATEAAASSSSAAQAATAAAASEDTVAQYAQAANASAQSAANNNDSAHQYANQASASASNATFHSSNAQTAATNAQTAATNAQTAATRTAALKDDCETLHRMCTAAVDQAATEAVNAANSAAQAAATKTDVETLVESLPEDFTDLNNTVNQLSGDIVDVKASYKNRKSKLSVETYSFFKGKKLASSFDADHVFNVSGSSGDTVLTITGDRSGNTLTSNDLNCAVVIQYNESKALPYILREFTENTITVYPAIDADINNAILAPFMADSQHLTIYGYRAYIQHVNTANPKHCEKNKFVAKYHPVNSTTPTVFSAMGVSSSIFAYSQNDNSAISYQYGNFGTIVYPYADYTTPAKYGLKWSVDTGNHAGYLETFVGIKAASGLSMYKDTGHEMFIDVYADGVLIQQIIKNTNTVERICVDYTKSQKTIELQVYYTTMRKNNNADSIFVGETTFWVNEIYPDSILPAGATVSLLFDSWGGRGSTETVVEPDTPWNSGATWPQGESGLEVRRILTAKSGFVPPVYNTSKGSMTSRWGRAWFGVAVRSKNPNVVLTDFGINDYHTTIGGTWENVLDPYGNTIVMANNPLTVAEYAENMQNIFNMAIMSDIQPIFVEPNIGASLPWTLYMINALAVQVEI